MVTVSHNPSPDSRGGRIWTAKGALWAERPGHRNGRNSQPLNSMPQAWHRRTAGPRS